MDTLFHPIKKGNKPEGIVLQIEAAILGGNFKAGDKLPSERHLQNLFQTSRGAVREALSSLRQKGLLETKKGAKGGYYIKEENINETIDQLALMIKKQRVPIKKLLDFQFAMDKAVLFEAIPNATESEIERLNDFADLLVELCREDTPDFEQIAMIDNKLNLLMVEMSKNPFFEWVMRTVQVSFREYEFIVYEQKDVRLAMGLNWQNTARAVRARDAQKAICFYAQWYIMFEECLETNLGDEEA